MQGFEIIFGHLLGDYILQNDWMASNKTNQWPGKEPGYKQGSGFVSISNDPNEWLRWREAKRAWLTGNLACFVHCVFYTFGVALACWSWMPLWGYAVVFGLHFPVDRWRLARRWMENVSGQKAFASGPLSPWSIIVVDNIAHLAVLYGVAKVVGGWRA